MKRILFSVGVTLFCASARAGFFGPTNYNECILKYAKGSQNQTATALIMNACDDKFSKTAKSNGQKNVGYDDCILRHMKGTKDTAAAGLIMISCDDEHPSTSHATHSKTAREESSKLPPNRNSELPATQGAPAAAIPAASNPKITAKINASRKKQAALMDKMRVKVYESITQETPGGRKLCQFKPIMSDDDYRRCGISPP